MSTEIRLSLEFSRRDSGPLVFSSQVKVGFFSGVLELAVTGAGKGWGSPSKFEGGDFP